MCDEGHIVLQESEFELLDNDTLLFGNDTIEIVGHNGRSPIICSNFTQNGTVPQHLTVFNYSYPPILSVPIYVCCSLFTEKDELCETTAMLLHLVMLSQFFWMSIMSFELLHTFYRASRPVEDKSTQKKYSSYTF